MKIDLDLSSKEFDMIIMTGANIEFGELLDMFPYKRKFKKLEKSVVGFVGFGCAELAGMVLVRCGIKNLIIIDADIFKPIDVSRSLFCFKSTMGKHKVDISKKFLKDANPKINLKIYRKFLSERNISVLKKANVIVEATGHRNILKMLLNFGKKNGKPIISFKPHKFKGAVTVFTPKNTSPLTSKFVEIKIKGKDIHPVLLAMIHALISNEVMKIALKGKNLIKFPKVALIDLKSSEPLKIRNFDEIQDELIC